MCPIFLLFSWHLLLAIARLAFGFAGVLTRSLCFTSQDGKGNPSLHQAQWVLNRGWADQTDLHRAGRKSQESHTSTLPPNGHPKARTTSGSAFADGKELLMYYYWKACWQTFVKYQNNKKIHVEMIDSFKANFECFAGNLWLHATFSTIRRRGKAHQDQHHTPCVLDEGRSLWEGCWQAVT